MATPLVSIGDSLTQGFQSGAISRCDLSYPVILRRALGLSETEFKHPDFSGAGGIPMNLEAVVRAFGRRPGFLDLPWIYNLLNRAEDYWERGAGAGSDNSGPIHELLAVWGYTVSDTFIQTDRICREEIPSPHNTIFNVAKMITEYSQYRTTRRTLNPARRPELQDLSAMGLAGRIAETTGGIENLIFALGANNVLGTLLELDIRESMAADVDRPAHLRQSNLWSVDHFRESYDRAAKMIDAIEPERVFVMTVPQIQLAPVVRGVSPGRKDLRDQEGLFEYYTRFWIWDDDFDPGFHPYLTGSEVRGISATIDGYNEIIVGHADARDNWFVVDANALFSKAPGRGDNFHPKDGFAFPPKLVTAMKSNPKTADRIEDDGTVLLDRRYVRIWDNEESPRLRYQGGLIALDGVHPTTVGYGILAHEYLRIMEVAGVRGADPRRLDWDWILENDRIVTEPPESLSALRELLGWIGSTLMLPRLLRCMSGADVNRLSSEIL